MSLTAAEVQILLKAHDQASGPIGNVNRALGGLGQQAGGVGSIMQGVLVGAAMAATQAVIGLGVAAGRAFVGLAGEALSATASYEKIGMSLTSLIAKELSKGQLVEQTRMVAISLTQDELAEIEKLTGAIRDEELDRNTLAASIQEQRQRVIDLTASYGEQGLNVQTAKAKLAEMENEYDKSGKKIGDMTGRIAALNSKQGQMVAQTTRVRTGQMSVADAMKISGAKAKELLNWTEKLAILSPFDQEGVAAALKTAMSYGFTTEKAKELTQATIDFAAGTGATTQTMDSIARALGQINVKGKLAGQEVMQLTEAGVAVDQILADAFGKSTAEIVAMREAGLIPADVAIQAIIDSLGTDFKNAAENSTNTIDGLRNSLGDIKKIGLREFFSTTFEALQPMVADIVGNITDDMEGFKSSVRDMGAGLGAFVGLAMQNIMYLFKVFQEQGLAGLGREFWKWLTGEGGVVSQISGKIGELLTGISTYLSENWKTIGDTLLGYAGIFWDWLTGTDGVVGKIATTVGGALTAIGTYLSENWATIGNTLWGWATEFWKWLTGEGGALSTVATEVGKIATTIGANWKPIGDAIAGWAISFWEWLTGTGGAGDEATVKTQLSTVGGTMAANYAGIGDQINSPWGINFWDWLTKEGGAIDYTEEQVGIIGMAITTNWPQIGDKLRPWGEFFWGWLTGPDGAIVFTATNMAKIIIAIGEWVESSTTQGALKAIAKPIGTLMADAVTAGYTMALSEGGANDRLATVKTIAFFWLICRNTLTGIMNIGPDLATYIMETYIGALPNSEPRVTEVMAGSLGRGFTLVRQLMTGDVIGLVAGIYTDLSAAWQAVNFQAMGQFLIHQIKVGVVLYTLGLLLQIQALYTIIKGVWEAINWKYLGECILTKIKERIEEATQIKRITDAVIALYSSVKTEWDKIEWETLGKDIIDGVIQGIKDKVKAAEDAAKELAEKLEGAMRNALGANSPSKVFAAVGKDIALGLLQGIQLGQASLSSPGRDLLDRTFQEWIKGIRESVPNYSSTLHKTIKKLSRTLLNTLTVENGTTAKEAAAKMLKQMTDLIATTSPSGAKMLKQQAGALYALLGNMAGTIVGSGPTLLESLFSIGGSLGNMGSAAAQRLQDTVINPEKEHLQLLIAQRQEMQEQGRILLAQGGINEEINVSRRKIAEAERLITNQQKAQADLQFLQQQSDLLKLIKDSGLNAKNILGGIKLGLDADLPAILKAMTRAMQEIIRAAQKELGIASESKVFKGLGRNVMGAMATGVTERARLPQQAVATAMANTTTNTFYITQTGGRDNSDLIGYMRLRALMGR